MQNMYKFNYLGVIISYDSGMEEEVAHEVFEGRKVWRSMAKLWKENMISRKVKQVLNERAVIPNLVYSSETWFLSAQERRKIEVLR